MRTTRGYSLPLVILVLGALAAAMSLMVVTLSSSAKTTGAMLGRRDSLYVCDGIVRGLMVKSRDYFATASTLDADDLRDHLCGASTAPNCPPINTWFPDYTIDNIAVGTGSTDVVAEVPTGNFRGQMARRTDIKLTVEAHKTGTNQRCKVSQSAINSEIGLFQFAVFSAMSIELLDPPSMNISGRVHINGDFLAGNTFGVPNLTIEKITVAGQLRAHGVGFNVRRSSDLTPILMTPSTDGDEAGWRTSSETTWQGNAQDEAWSVPSLTLPASSSTAAQSGRDASGTNRSNSGMLRILVDPPRASDTPSIAKERLANKANIRIINGVWYYNNGTWPGIPIWSDHPATYTNADTDEANIVAPFSLATVPTSAAGPKRYSYYEVNLAGTVQDDSALPSVVSYGPIVKSSGLKLAHYTSSLVQSLTDEDRVDGTMTGFTDGRVQNDRTNGIDNPAVQKGHILPLNFDVGAFILALQDTTNNELGTHISAAEREKGVIVWIANTWTNSNNGFPNLPAGKPVSTAGPEQGLPLPLCGGSGVLSGSIFRVGCVSSGMRGANAVRVWNASTISPTVLPRGLTIATNGPVYVLGDTNTGSLESGAPAVPYVDNNLKTWVPLMIAGDAVTLLSNNWSDVGRAWNSSSPLPANLYTLLSAGDAQSTTYVMAVLGGHVERAGGSESGGVNNFPRFLEAWNGRTATIHGSLVAGYRSVYQDQGFIVPGMFNPGPYLPPSRDWRFDPNFAKPANQPPGTPSFFVSAIERWNRD